MIQIQTSVHTLPSYLFKLPFRSFEGAAEPYAAIGVSFVVPKMIAPCDEKSEVDATHGSLSRDQAASFCRCQSLD